MKARAADASRRLCRGTWLGIEAWGCWLSGASHADRPGLVRLGVIGRRLTGSLFAVVFYGSILQRAPYLIYAVPVAWAWAAWQMSELRATPPPGDTTPLGSEEAGQNDPNGTTLAHREGMLIYLTPDPTNPHRTSVRVEHVTDETHA